MIKILEIKSLTSLIKLVFLRDEIYTLLKVDHVTFEVIYRVGLGGGTMSRKKKTK